MTGVLEDALRRFLARPIRRPTVEPFRMPTAEGRPLPGVDLDDPAALWDLTEKPR